MILNYIQFLLSLFDQGVVKSTIVSLNCVTLNVDNVNLDDFDYWCHKWFGSNVLNGDCSRTVYFRSLFRNEPDHDRSGEMLQIIEHLFI